MVPIPIYVPTNPNASVDITSNSSQVVSTFDRMLDVYMQHLPDMFVFYIVCIFLLLTTFLVLTFIRIESRCR